NYVVKSLMAVIRDFSLLTILGLILTVLIKWLKFNPAYGKQERQNALKKTRVIFSLFEICLFS
ncbi:MAG: hypothetical protein O2951_00500, partial [Bacteroidetes bacterium]|nr:hypothetical protein [Bacteroidota bacterium]